MQKKAKQETKTKANVEVKTLTLEFEYFPIDTAPKTGVVVDVYKRPVYGSMLMMLYSGPQWCPASKWTRAYYKLYKPSFFKDEVKGSWFDAKTDKPIDTPDFWCKGLPTPSGL